MSAGAGGRPSKSQEPGTPSKAPTEVTGLQQAWGISYSSQVTREQEPEMWSSVKAWIRMIGCGNRHFNHHLNCLATYLLSSYFQMKLLIAEMASASKNYTENLAHLAKPKSKESVKNTRLLIKRSKNQNERFISSNFESWNSTSKSMKNSWLNSVVQTWQLSIYCQI